MTTTQTITVKYRFAGMADDTPNCECCGRRIKKAVLLFALDADGNIDEMVRYGTGCAATALSWVSFDGKPGRRDMARVTAEAAAAQRRRADEIDWARRVIRRYALLARLGTVREIAREYFACNPYTGTPATVAVAEMLAEARAILARHRVAA